MRSLLRKRPVAAGPPRPSGPGRIARFAACMILAAALAGCGPDSGHERVPLEGARGIDRLTDELPAAVQLQLDSGNLAYRERDYARALSHFDEAVRLEPELSAAWYGIGMAQSALGNRAAADSAMARVRALSPEVPLDHPGSPGADPSGSPDPSAY